MAPLTVDVIHFVGYHHLDGVVPCAEKIHFKYSAQSIFCLVRFVFVLFPEEDNRFLSHGKLGLFYNSFEDIFAGSQEYIISFL